MYHHSHAYMNYHYNHDNELHYCDIRFSNIAQPLWYVYGI